jgi:hypothetical protein
MREFLREISSSPETIFGRESNATNVKVTNADNCQIQFANQMESASDPIEREILPGGSETEWSLVSHPAAAMLNASTTERTMGET